MLDYKTLRKDFSTMLQQFGEQKLESWLAFDRRRDMLEDFFIGEEIFVVVDTICVSKLKNRIHIKY